MKIFERITKRYALQNYYLRRNFYWPDTLPEILDYWQQHNALGESLVAGLKNAGVKIFSGGSMEMDLTQTSYSTIPSIDIELGDGASDHSASTLDQLGTGLADGVDAYFGK